MSISLGMQLLTFACMAVLSAMVFRKNLGNKANLNLFAFSFFLACWNLCGLIEVFQIKTGQDPLIASMFSLTSASLFFLAFVNFCRYFPYQEKGKNQDVLFILLSCMTAVSVFLSFNRKYISSFEIVGGVGVRHFTPWIYYFVFCSLTFAGFGFYTLLKKYLTIKVASYKNQLKFVFTGMAVGLSIVLPFSLFLPIMGYNQLFFLGEIGPLFFAGFTIYAIVKHHLMDIDIIFRRGIIYSGLVIVATGTYVLFALSLGQIFNNTTKLGTSTAMLLTTIVIVAGFKPLETFIENVTEKVFYKRKRDYQRTLKDLTHRISKIDDINTVFHLILSSVMEVMRISKAVIWLKDDNGDWQEISSGKDPSAGNISSEKIEADLNYTQYLAGNKEIISLEEIEYVINIQKMPDSTEKELRYVINIMKDAGFVVAIPIIVNENLEGVLNLGGKLSEDIYTLQDLELLSILTDQISVALENAKLKEKLKRAERLSELGKLASSFAHEIRNPLTSIKAFFQILDSSEDEEDKREISGIASAEIVRVEGLIENLLSFARPREPKFEHTDLRDVIDETLSVIRLESISSDLKVTKNYAKSMPEVMVDRMQMKQVLMNIIFNAVHSMPGGGELRIELAHDGKTDSIVLTISDTGVGIDAKHLPMVFEPFFTTKSQGTGLGLSICRSIIENHRGKITITSKKDKGTSVQIQLPAEQIAR